jgi:GH24 family phage-related lysozyme (muramidase)
MILTIVDYEYHLYENKFKALLAIDKLYLLLESDISNEFEWDLTDVIKKDSELIKKLKLGKDVIFKYINKIISKIKALPYKFRLKLFKNFVLGFVSILSFNEMITIIDEFNTLNELNKTELVKIVNLAYNRTEIVNSRDVFKKPITFSNNLIDFLKHEEGSIKHKGEPVLTAYDIGDGMLTIGFGHAERVSKTKMKVGHTTITHKEALNLLKYDILDAKMGLDKILDNWKDKKINYNITQGMYDSMISMIFNMGIGNFRKTDFIQLVKSGNYSEAKHKIKSTAISYPGHIPRRKKEADFFNT